MDKEILKKALPLGIGSAVLTWLLYALVFEMLIEHKPANEAFFSSGKHHLPDCFRHRIMMISLLKNEISGKNCTKHGTEESNHVFV